MIVRIAVRTIILNCPRGPTPIEPGGSHAHSPSPQPSPLSQEKDIRMLTYLGYWLPLVITKNTPFPSFLGKSSQDYTVKNTPFPEKMGTRMRPPYAFEWGPGELPTSNNGIHVI